MHITRIYLYTHESGEFIVISKKKTFFESLLFQTWGLAYTPVDPETHYIAETNLKLKVFLSRSSSWQD